MKQIEIGTAKSRRGEWVFGELPVTEINDGTPISVPVAILQGLDDGPCLWIQNAVHGDEYVGLGAMHRLMAEIRPHHLRGSLILIPVLNRMAYRAGARMAPQDGLDMNRIWPGNPMETAMHLWAHSELVAHEVIGHIKRYADCVLDVHDAGWMGLMSPYVAYYTGAGELDQKVRDISCASGMGIVWETVASWVAEKVPGSIKTQMTKAGIPSVTLEAGGEGRLNENDVDWMLFAYRNIARHLGLLPGQPETRGEQVHVSKAHWLRARKGGVLWAKARQMQRVREGELLAVTTDLFGRTAEEFRSPVDGIVIGYRTFGTVSTGQYVINVAT